MNRSKLPKMARWMTTGRCSALSAPMYFRSKRSGMLVIQLDRRALPLPADRVGDVEVDLRSVERAVALVDACTRCPVALERGLELRLRRDPTSRSRREIRPAACESFAVKGSPKSPYTRCTSRISRSHLLADLLLRHEAVRIVLRKLPDAREARRARPTPRCDAAASARASGSADRDSCGPRWRRRASAPGSSSASSPSCSPSDVDEEHVLPVVLPVPGASPTAPCCR